MLLTACEKGLVDGVADVAPAGQAANSVLPTTDDAAATSAIALREGHSHGDLMAAQATATLTDGGTNTVRCPLLSTFVNPAHEMAK